MMTISISNASLKRLAENSELYRVEYVLYVTPHADDYKNFVPKDRADAERIARNNPSKVSGIPTTIEPYGGKFYIKIPEKWALHWNARYRSEFTKAEAEKEAQKLKSQGHQHVRIVRYK